MKWKFINVPLGVSETPIGTSRCCASGALDLIGSVFGTVGDYAAAVNTAQENRWAQEETNESNERINQEQLAWARENYKLEKEENRFLVDQAYQRELENRQHNEWYNSPAQELQRLRAAGLNPYLAKYGNGAAGSASGHSIGAQVGSPARHNQPNMIPMQASHEQAFNGFGVAGQNMANYILAAEKQEADISAMKTDLKIKAFDAITKANERKFNSSVLDATAKKILKDIQFQEENWDTLSNNLKKLGETYEADVRYKDSLTSLNQQAEQLNIDANNRAWVSLRGQLALWSAQSYMYNMQGYQAQEQGYLTGLNASEQEKRLNFVDDIYKNNKEQANQILMQLKYKTSVQGWRDFTAMISGIIPFAGIKYPD